MEVIETTRHFAKRGNRGAQVGQVARGFRQKLVLQVFGNLIADLVRWWLCRTHNLPRRALAQCRVLEPANHRLCLRRKLAFIDRVVGIRFLDLDDISDISDNISDATSATIQWQ